MQNKRKSPIGKHFTFIARVGQFFMCIVGALCVTRTVIEFET